MVPGAGEADMVTAYITVKSMVGEVEDIREEILGIEGVVDVHIVAGDVDIIAQIDVESPEEIREVVTARIHDLAGIESTQTYVAMD